MQNVDMKSLQVFLCMLRECNVTRTAQQLHMSQSAVSHTLTRLRVLFDDPLFVSMGRGMLPTQRAEALQAPPATQPRCTGNAAEAGQRL
ncbi:LysR family transcriptional regulator [Metapseudomonas otitidis]|uniref:LysR family transcriptional regulator n=1 Tax=Metapseudomonas otitidis TaxID=319939 RepID=UPI0013F5AA0E|nr:LysR family transcriptional regulator [Pseudomonas otitidis]